MEYRQILAQRQEERDRKSGQTQQRNFGDDGYGDALREAGVTPEMLKEAGMTVY